MIVSWEWPMQTSSGADHEHSSNDHSDPVHARLAMTSIRNTCALRANRKQQTKVCTPLANLARHTNSQPHRIRKGSCSQCQKQTQGIDKSHLQPQGWHHKCCRSLYPFSLVRGQHYLDSRQHLPSARPRWQKRILEIRETRKSSHRGAACFQTRSREIWIANECLSASGKKNLARNNVALIHTTLLAEEMPKDRTTWHARSTSVIANRFETNIKKFLPQL